jgi:hypothetical protein
MILELLFAIPIFILIWFIIFKVKLKYDKAKLLKDLPEKIRKQDKKFYSDGKEIDLKKSLGLEVEKKEVVSKTIITKIKEKVLLLRGIKNGN